MSEKAYITAIIETYREVMEDFDEAIVLGEDVRKALLNTSIGLADDFGEDRVRDTPIAEPGFTGIGIGAAMDGKRPIVEYQINTIPHLTMEQVVNNAGRIHHMSNGEFSVPMTITVPMAGSPGGLGPQHSEAPHAGMMHYGIKQVIPSTPYDAKGLLRSAVEDDDPVVVYFPVVLHATTGDVPDETYRIPLGEADVKREGSDVTVVAVGEAVHDALAVADEYENEASIEVIDLRTPLPIDEETIFDSLEKTGRIIIMDTGNRMCGAASEIAARVANRSLFELEAPVKRVTRADAPISYAEPEEEYVLPDQDSLSQAVDDVLSPH
jgi:pyruvate dehydrogenase E1 component beta subunit